MFLPVFCQNNFGILICIWNPPEFQFVAIQFLSLKQANYCMHLDESVLHVKGTLDCVRADKTTLYRAERDAESWGLSPEMDVSLTRIFAFSCCRAFLMFYPENSSITANNDKHHQHQREPFSPSTSVSAIIFSKLLVKIPFNCS